MQTVWHVPHHRPEVANIRDPWLFETDRLVPGPGTGKSISGRLSAFTATEIVRHRRGSQKDQEPQRWLVRLDSTRDRFRTDGLGRWAMERKKRLGVLSVPSFSSMSRKGTPNPAKRFEIGWHLCARRLGGGATPAEAARALLRHGFRRPPRIKLPKSWRYTEGECRARARVCAVPTGMPRDLEKRTASARRDGSGCPGLTEIGARPHLPRKPCGMGATPSAAGPGTKPPAAWRPAQPDLDHQRARSACKAPVIHSGLCAAAARPERSSSQRASLGPRADGEFRSSRASAPGSSPATARAAGCGPVPPCGDPQPYRPDQRSVAVGQRPTIPDAWRSNRPMPTSPRIEPAHSARPSAPPGAAGPRRAMRSVERGCRSSQSPIAPQSRVVAAVALSSGRIASRRSRACQHEQSRAHREVVEAGDAVQQIRVRRPAGVQQGGPMARRSMASRFGRSSSACSPCGRDHAGPARTPASACGATRRGWLGPFLVRRAWPRGPASATALPRSPLIASTAVRFVQAVSRGRIDVEPLIVGHGLSAPVQRGGELALIERVHGQAGRDIAGRQRRQPRAPDASSPRDARSFRPAVRRRPSAGRARSARGCGWP